MARSVEVPADVTDWRQRFRAGRVENAARARHHPDHGLVIANHDGNSEAYAWTVPTGSLRRLSDSGTAVLEAAIRPDGSSIVYHRDTTGSEFGHLHEVAFGGGAAVDLTPSLPPYVAYGLRASADVLVAGMATNDEQAVLRVRGDDAAVWPQDALVAELWLADDGASVGVGEPMSGLFGRTVLRTLDDGAVIDRLDMSWPGPMQGDQMVVAIHRDGWMRPARWTPGHAPELLDVDLPGDVRAVDWSDDGRTLLLTQWHRGSGALATFDVATGTCTSLQSPGGWPMPWHWPELHGDAATAIWSDARRPWSVWESSADDARRMLSVSSPDEYPGTDWEAVDLVSADGTPVQGWLLRPPTGAPSPAILHGHGGPTSAMGPVFHPVAQAWADAGYAFLSVNYRGSTTFGDDFREALTGHVGEVDVADMMAGHDWLLRSGVADPARIFVNGYSYGCYLALHCPALHPEAFAGGIAGAPIADWLLMGEDQNAALDAYDRALFGGDRAETAEHHRRASPRSYVERFAAPILITTPSEDTRTPLRPIQAFVDDMRAAGKDVELHLLEGGHAGVGIEQDIEMTEAWLRFADKIVGEAVG